MKTLGVGTDGWLTIDENWMIQERLMYLGVDSFPLNSLLATMNFYAVSVVIPSVPLVLYSDTGVSVLKGPNWSAGWRSTSSLLCPWCYWPHCSMRLIHIHDLKRPDWEKNHLSKSEARWRLICTYLVLWVFLRGVCVLPVSLLAWAHWWKSTEGGGDGESDGLRRGKFLVML